MLLYWSAPGYQFVPLRLTPSGISVWTIVWTTGVAFAVSLIGGPICNPDLGERTYSGVGRRHYFWAAGLFGLGVLIFGSLGFLAWHLGLTVESGKLPTFALLNHLMPSSLLLVSIGLVVILTAAFASMFASAANLLSIELVRPMFPNMSDNAMVWVSRAAMIVPILIAAWFASLPKETLDLGMILLSLAVIRGQAIVPVVLAVFKPEYASGRAIFWGMLAAFVTGLGFTFGAPFWKYISGDTVQFLAAHGKPIGALCALLVPLVFAFVAHHLWARRRITDTAR